MNDWKRIEKIIKQGQNAMLRLRLARVPVIPALCGYTLGGACELSMQTPAAQAHSGTRIGLVETDLGLIPAWGGTSAHLFRAVERGGDDIEAILQHALTAFRQMAGARKSANADDAFAMRLLAKPSLITINRERLLPDARSLCLMLARNYRPQESVIIEVPVKALHERLVREAEAMCERQPGMEMHRKKTLHILAETLSGYRAVNVPPPPHAGWSKLTWQAMLDATREAFMELVDTKEALEKIRKVLEK